MMTWLHLLFLVLKLWCIPVLIIGLILLAHRNGFPRVLSLFCLSMAVMGAMDFVAVGFDGGSRGGVTNQHSVGYLVAYFGIGQTAASISSWAFLGHLAFGWWDDDDDESHRP